MTQERPEPYPVYTEVPPSSESPQPLPPTPPSQPISAQSTQTQRTWAMLCHLAGFAVFLFRIFPLANIVTPLAIWLIKKHTSPLVEDQGRESLNFQITISIALAISGLLIFARIGFVLVPLILIYDVVMIITAAIRANEGEWYKYPYSLRLIK